MIELKCGKKKEMMRRRRENSKGSQLRREKQGPLPKLPTGPQLILIRGGGKKKIGQYRTTPTVASVNTPGVVGRQQAPQPLGVCGTCGKMHKGPCEWG